MNMTHTNGVHKYRGLLNSRSQRQRSKIYKGLNINLWKVNKAFRKLDAEQSNLLPTGGRGRAIHTKARGRDFNTAHSTS